jgi:hypothetical protein
MANTKSTGDISEAVVMAEFLKAGFPVLLPFGDNQRYDMVVEVSGRLLRVQCKTGSPCGWKGNASCIRFNAHSGAFGPDLFLDLRLANPQGPSAPVARRVLAFNICLMKASHRWVPGNHSG